MEFWGVIFGLVSAVATDLMRQSWEGRRKRVPVPEVQMRVHTYLRGHPAVVELYGLQRLESSTMVEILAVFDRLPNTEVRGGEVRLGVTRALGPARSPQARKELAAQVKALNLQIERRRRAIVVDVRDPSGPDADPVAPLPAILPAGTRRRDPFAGISERIARYEQQVESGERSRP